MKTSPAPGSRHPRPQRGAVARDGAGGFTMVEVMIAIVVLAIGILGMAGTTAYIVRQVTLADLMTERAAAFQTTIDRVQSLEYDSVTSGSDSVGVFGLSWSAVDDGAQNKIVTIVTVGPGLDRAAPFPMIAPEVADTFRFRVLRR